MTAISQKIQELIAQGIDPGAARTDEMPCRDGGMEQLFENLTVLHHPGIGTFALQTVIRDAYVDDGGIDSSSLGYPTSDEQDDPDTADGRQNTFQFGRITWNALHGTYIDRPDTPPGTGPTRPYRLSVLDDVTGRVLEELNIVPGMTQREGKADRSGYIADLMQERSTDLPGGQSNAGDWKTMVQEFEQNNVPIFREWASRPMSQVQHLVAEAADKTGEFRFVTATADVPGSDTFDVVLARPGDVHPKLIAVSFPKSLLTTDELPVLVYFHPTLGQAQKPEKGLNYYTLAPNLKSVEDGEFYPFGWDFLYFNFWNYLNYPTPGFNTAYSVGMNYQRQLAGKDVITVLPVLHPHDSIGVGDFLNPDRLLTILGEIKWHFTQKVSMTDDNFVAPENFRVAIGAFSSATPLLARLVSHTDTVFCRECLKEVYFFDPPESNGDDCISRAMRWAGGNGDKHVRFYSQTAFSTFNRVVGSKAQVKYHHVVTDPANPNHSAALLNSKFWQGVATGPLLEQIKTSEDYSLYHSLIASGMLTDALARSGF